MKKLIKFFKNPSILYAVLYLLTVVIALNYEFKLMEDGISKDHHLIYLMNSDLRKMIFFMPIFLIGIYLLIYLRSEPNIVNIGFTIVMTFEHLARGVILFFKIKYPLWSEKPNIPWNDWQEYKSYQDQFFIYPITFLLFFVIIYINYKMDSSSKTP